MVPPFFLEKLTSPADWPWTCTACRARCYDWCTRGRARRTISGRPYLLRTTMLTAKFSRCIGATLSIFCRRQLGQPSTWRLFSMSDVAPSDGEKSHALIEIIRSCYEERWMNEWDMNLQGNKWRRTPKKRWIDRIKNGKTIAGKLDWTRYVRNRSLWKCRTRPRPRRRILPRWIYVYTLDNTKEDKNSMCFYFYHLGYLSVMIYRSMARNTYRVNPQIQP